MTPTGCPVGLCDDESACRFCDNGGRRYMDGGELQRVWMLHVNAMRECQRAEARARTLDDDCTMLARRNVKLILEVDQLHDEISVLRRAVAPEHLQAQIAMLTYENEQLRQRNLTAALYGGEG